MVTIEVTEDEARAMRTLFARVGGCRDNSPRGHITSVDKKLAAAGTQIGTNTMRTSLSCIFFDGYDGTPVDQMTLDLADLGAFCAGMI